MKKHKNQLSFAFRHEAMDSDVWEAVWTTGCGKNQRNPKGPGTAVQGQDSDQVRFLSLSSAPREFQDYLMRE